MSALAAKRQLLEALANYVEAVAGDGAMESRGRGSRSAGRADGDLVNAALELHSRLAQGSEGEPSPGARSARRASAGAGFDAVAGRARDMLRGR